MYLTQGLRRSLQRHPDKIALRHLGAGDAAPLRHEQLQAADSGRCPPGRSAGAARRACRRSCGPAGPQRRPPGAGRAGLLVAGCRGLPIEHALAPRRVVRCTGRWRTGIAADRRGAADADASKEGAPAVPIIGLNDFAAQAADLVPLPDSRTGGDALATLLYTGGTTGCSKGVMLSHANFWTACMSRGAELNNAPDAVSLLVTPLFHVAGLSRFVGQSLVGGACVTPDPVQARCGDRRERVAGHHRHDHGAHHVAGLARRTRFHAATCVQREPHRLRCRAEVETALRAHPHVAQAAVVGVPDERWGEAVHACIVPKPTAGEAQALQDAPRAWCRERLAGYKCPRGYTVIDALPLSAAGKVLKNELRERARESAA